MNIIEIILKNKKEQTGMSAANFFTENNPHGYFDKPSLREYFTKYGQTNLVNLKSLFELTSNGVSIDNLPRITDDNVTGEPCMWLTAKLPKSQLKLKLMVAGRLVQVIEDYQYGRISPTFTLEDLYNEVTNEPAEPSAD